MACEKSVVAGAKPMWVPQSKNLKLKTFVFYKFKMYLQQNAE